MTFATGRAPHAAPGRLPFLSPGNLPDTGIEPMSLVSPAVGGGFFTTSTTWEAALHNPQKATLIIVHVAILSINP